MRFEISHRFDAAPETIADILLDEAFQASLVEASHALAHREVLSQEPQSDGRVVRRVRSVLGIDMGPAARFIGDAEPAWVEEAIWHPDELRWVWEIHPEVGGNILEASGETVLEAEREGTVRRVVGDVRVRVPLYGGRVERWIVDGMEEAYEGEAERLSARLEGSG